MSFENTDERLERLEKQFARMLNRQKGTIEFAGSLLVLDQKILNQFRALSKSHHALVRFIYTGPLVQDEVMKVQLLEKLSQIEKAFEETDDLFAGLETLQDLIPPLPDL